MNGFYQNTTKGTFGWNLIKNIIQKPTESQKQCQSPKPILLDTGEIGTLHPWQPEILDIQLFRIGNVFIYAVPSEFTTMSGRRLRESIKNSLIQHQLGDHETVVIHSGPANGYAVSVRGFNCDRESKHLHLVLLRNIWRIPASTLWRRIGKVLLYSHAVQLLTMTI